MLVGILITAADLPVRADAACGSPGSRRIPLLARPGAGSIFTTIGTDGAWPYLDYQSGTTMVPVRSLVAVIGAGDGDVRWDESTRTATFIRSGLTLSFSFVPGSHTSDRARVNGQSVAIDSVICDGRLYAPARFVAKALGVGLKWYPDGTVVVDPAWGPQGPAESGPDVGVHRPVVPAPTQTPSCEAVPTRLVEIIRAPASAYWQATRATACQILRGG